MIMKLEWKLRELDRETNRDFIDLIRWGMTYSKDRNKDWFQHLVNEQHLYHTWTLCYLEDKLVAFSAIQTHKFPDGYARLLTRTFYVPDIRTNIVSAPDNLRPSGVMARHQYGKVFGHKRFVSMEHIPNKAGTRRAALQKVMDKTLGFKVLDRMYQTFIGEEEDWRQWQSVATDIPEEEFDLPSISRDEYLSRFVVPRHSVDELEPSTNVVRELTINP